MNLMIFIVVVLDPRYKLDYVEWMINESIVLIKNLKETLFSLYEEYRVLPSTFVPKEEVSLSAQKKVEVLKNKYKKHKCEKEGELKMELDKYLEEDKRKILMILISWDGGNSTVPGFLL